jgi:cyclophilin family peptidyl-prolyl cis-trans isomerase
MTRHLWPALVAATVFIAGLALAQTPAANPKVLLKTTLGDITLELYPAKAPITVKNFMDYVNDRFYDGTIFHRVIPSFMVQGGGLTADMTTKATKGTIKNESGNGLKNLRGSVAMARLQELDSANSQFFINVIDNAALDEMKYCVFAKVVAGMDVVDKIVAVPRGTRRGHGDVPLEPITILSATVVK